MLIQKVKLLTIRTNSPCVAGVFAPQSNEVRAKEMAEKRFQQCDCKVKEEEITV